MASRVLWRHSGCRHRRARMVMIRWVWVTLWGWGVDVSFELWVKPSSFASRQNVVSKAVSGEGQMTQETNGRLSFYDDP